MVIAQRRIMGDMNVHAPRDTQGQTVTVSRMTQWTFIRTFEFNISLNSRIIAIVFLLQSRTISVSSIHVKMAAPVCRQWQVWDTSAHVQEDLEEQTVKVRNLLFFQVSWLNHINLVLDPLDNGSLPIFPPECSIKNLTDQCVHFSSSRMLQALRLICACAQFFLLDHSGCDVASCQNGGTCYETEFGVRCICKNGYSGDKCQSKTYDN